MRKSLLFGAMLLVASCTVQKEEEFENPAQHRYHAVAEEPVDAETRVYADSKLRVRWNEGDHISIFERNTYNQEYEFLGDTGDTAGDFEQVESSGYHTGGPIEDGHVYAIYPYHNRNKCDYDGKLTVDFPSTQHYKKDSFGVGANVMVAKTNTLDLRFMHVGGYRTFKLYGEGVFVSSVRIESNGPEYLSGRTEVVIGSDDNLAISFIESTSNSKSVELVCDTPVALGATDDDAVEFWFVLPPGTLTQGFTVTITDINGNEFTRSTSNSIEIKSGVKKSMTAFEVELEPVHPNNVIYYTSSDGNVIAPFATNVFGANLVSNEYVGAKGIMVFDADVTMIGDSAFKYCESLTGITIPDSVKSIGESAFSGCENLSDINIPDSVKSIGENSFELTSLTSFTIPEGVTTIESNTFASCFSLASVTIPESVKYIKSGAFTCCSALSGITLPNNLESIESDAFSNCYSLTSIVIPSRVTIIDNWAFGECGNLSQITLPDGLEIIESYAFYSCESLTSISIPPSVTSIGSNAFEASGLTKIVIPESVTSIGDRAFYGCTRMASITVEAVNPPADVTNETFDETNECPIYVPAASMNRYRDSWGWYAYRMYAIPPQTELAGHAYVDMGNGLKWATMNIGATSEEEYGDYFAWGETETKESYTMANYVLASIPESETNPNGTGWKFINKYTFADRYTEGIWYNASGEFIGDNKSTFADYNYEDDAAREHWGSTWRTPTAEEWQWLLDNCYDEHVANYKNTGINGLFLISNINGNELFLPEAGYRYATNFYPNLSHGRYWSSTRSSSESDYAVSLLYGNNGPDTATIDDMDRFLGYPIRAVSN